ncbi:uncharacterized protein FIESC28_05852 [Fusarium coffeatum]|uniref:Uncharacterized protein n=1 Tax=Fusarium coffeatum TaxID=231269 RepID=A0A366RR87_9HYPO|nr:uncharacterized protein FIESC28_05852 [Fusarium coffeatum]RBR18930.1 hypothetical protein FIESC28_05852 [Fusarium coffeatum]
MTDKRYSMTPIRSSTAQPYLPTENMPNNQRSLTPVPLLEDTDFLRKAWRYPPMAPRPVPPPSVAPRSLLPYPGYCTSPRPTTPSGSTCPAPRAPLQELPLPTRSPSPTFVTDAVEAFEDIADMAKAYGEKFVERAESDAKCIRERIQKLRDETDARIKELEEEFYRKTREPQESLERLRALVAAQKTSLGLIERWKEMDRGSTGMNGL